MNTDGYILDELHTLIAAVAYLADTVNAIPNDSAENLATKCALLARLSALVDALSVVVRAHVRPVTLS
jgi:hypothetical protein